MYRDGEFGWTIMKAKVVTNSVVVRDNVSRAIKCACEQNRRRLYFVLESISGKEDEREEAMRRISNQGGIFESNEYSIMYREGEFGWTITKAKVVTNSVAVRQNVNRRLAGRCCMKIVDNKWMKYVVAEGIRKEP